MNANANAVAVPQQAQITELPRNDPGAVMEQVIIRGDLSDLKPAERARYYVEVCRSLGLNPLTRPFLYVKFSDGGLQLYPRKEAADQLRGLHKVQTRIVEQKVEQGVYVCVIEARHPDGRVETDIGAVPVKGLEGLFLANAMKKSITQGKRRATLAMLGLSLIDDDEIRAIKGAQFIESDEIDADGTATARVIERPALVEAVDSESVISEKTMRRLHAEMRKRCEGDPHEALREFAYKTLPLDDDFHVDSITEGEAQTLLTKVLDLPVINEPIGATEFWKFARAAGVTSKQRFQEITGCPLDGMDWADAVDLLNDALMPAVDAAVDRAVSA